MAYLEEKKKLEAFQNWETTVKKVEEVKEKVKTEKVRPLRLIA